jgi:hypothetical protein
MRIFILAAMAAALVGCETTASQGKPLMDYPEGKALAYCLRDRAREVAHQTGGPLELGIVVASMCSNQRYALRTAVARTEGDRYADLVMRGMEREDAKLAAEAIVRYRS